MVLSDMGLEFKWHSHQGRRTSDNRDYCGIGVRNGAALCIVLDGSTAASQSGALVQFIAQELVDWFVKTPEPATPPLVEAELALIHKRSGEAFPAGSASYAILLVESRTTAVSFHAGDCLIGKMRQPEAVCWLTRPHTLANAIDDLTVEEIAATNVRNRLTRSFRPGPFLRPEAHSIEIDRATDFIVATDGFWAGLAAEQQLTHLSDDKDTRDLPDDDCSALIVHFQDEIDGVRIPDDAPKNLYVAFADEMA